MKQLLSPHVTLTLAGPAITTLLITSSEPGVAIGSIIAAVSTLAVKLLVVTETKPRLVAGASCVKFPILRKRSAGTVIVSVSFA